MWWCDDSMSVLRPGQRYGEGQVRDEEEEQAGMRLREPAH